MPSDSENEDSQSLLTQMAGTLGGDNEEGQGDNGEEATQATLPASPRAREQE